MSTSRRSFLAAAAAAAATAPALFAKSSKAPFKIGVATYSLRKFSRPEAIEMLKRLDVQYVSVKEFHLKYVSTPEEIAAARKEFAAAGIKILSGGNVGMAENDEAKLRKYFDYAKAAGMPMMVCAPTHQTLPIVHKLAKEYKIKLAIHNHGPEDKHFPSPQSVLEAIKGFDPLVGLCIDVGHTARTGVDVVESIKLAGPRLLDMHFKDLREFKGDKARDTQVAVGEGIMPVREIFQALKQIKYKGGCMLEYEIFADKPEPGMAKSLEHMRKMAASLDS
ncbi:MAG: sugar phosphate isomerase/epimerase [Bryobacterales bacterium]|nr:sugar phosphate isomerase/epimerase [Bryobacterales bacterium]